MIAMLKERDLIIVPHGVLHYIPMNALHDGKDYLIDRYNIRLMPSASTMKYLREKKNDKPHDPGLPRHAEDRQAERLAKSPA